MKIDCDICGTSFDAQMKSQKRCSAKCRKIYHRKWMFDRCGDKSWRKEINCSICNIFFFPRSHNQTMCSSKCKTVYSKLKMRETAKKKIIIQHNRKCKVCEKDFSTNRIQKTTCSRKCSLRNKTLSQFKRPYRKKPEFKLYHRIRTTINNRINGRIKNSRIRTNKIIDYSIVDLKTHLELNFKAGMSWDNYGRKGWHIDHVKPLSAFVFFDNNGKLIMEQVKAALSLGNLQPLWALENLKKGGVRKKRMGE